MDGQKFFSKSNKRIAHTLLIISLLATACLIVFAGSASAGIVTSGAGTPIEGTLVKLTAYPQYNDTTDVNGNYTINNVPYGTYTISASAAGYATNTSTVIVDSGTVTKDFILTAGMPYYLPFLYQRDDHIGYDYDGVVQVQNSGTVNSSVEITFYNKNGSVDGSEVYQVSPGKLLEVRPFDITNRYPIYNAAPLVTADAPQQVQGYIKTQSLDVYSIAPSLTETTTKAYIPFLYYRADGIGYDYDAGVQVFNPGDTSANVNLVAYYKNGTESVNITYPVSSKNQVTKTLNSLAAGRLMLNGPAEITSDQPIAVQGFIRTKASLVYSIAPSVIQTTTSTYFPFLYYRADGIGFDYDAGVQVFNPGAITANVNLVAYYKNGTESANITYPVGPKNQVTKTLNSLAAGRLMLNGPVSVTSDQPITVQGFIRTAASKVYSIAPMVNKPVAAGEIHIPYLYQTLNNSHDAGIQVFNPNSASTTVEETLYYSNGTKAGNTTFTIGPYEQITKTVFSIAPGTDFEGYGLVSSTDQPVVGQAFIRTKGGQNIYCIAPPVER